MSKLYRLVVFDWEGTLGDTFGHVLNALKLEANRMNIGVVNESLARRYLILGLPVALKKVFPDLPMTKHKHLFNAIQAALACRSVDAYLLPGAKAILEKLKCAGMDLAIATNKGHQSLQRAIQSTGLENVFSVTRSADQAPAKPCPTMLEEIIDECGVPPSETLMVGDSETDIKMASDIGVAAVGVNFYSQQEQIQDLLNAGAIHVFEDYETLYETLFSERS